MIAEIGPDVHGWKVGDRVAALLAGGGYAEKVTVPATQLLPVPEGLDLRAAASLPEVACTVWSNLVMECGLHAGQVLLVHGGGGGIAPTRSRSVRRSVLASPSPPDPPTSSSAAPNWAPRS